MLPVELVRHDTLLVRLQAIDGLEPVFLRQEPSFSRAVVRPPVRDKTDCDGQESEEKVDDLVSMERAGVDATKAVDDWGAEECAETIAAVPASNTERLFRSPVKRDGDHREERDDGGLKSTQKKPRRHQTGIVRRSGQTSSNGDTPAGDDDGQNMAVSKFDQDPSGQRLHAELCIVSNVANVGIVVALEMRIGFQSVNSRQTNDALVC